MGKDKENKGGRPKKDQGVIVESEIKSYYSDEEIDALVNSGEWPHDYADYYREVRDLPTGRGGKVTDNKSQYPDAAKLPGSSKVGNVGRSHGRKRY
jgi:hypothetical protein